MNRSNSQQLFERARQFIPGGVNSPVRAFGQVGGTPVFFKSAAGAWLMDEDDNRYIDYIGSWGPMLLGHAYPGVQQAIMEAAAGSTSFGAPTAREAQMAELVCRLVPNVERVRMLNSGTEACMAAIRLARGHTGRKKVLKFAGCYHGHADAFLIQAGSGAATMGVPNSPGVTPGTAQDTLLAPYNDLQAVRALFEANPDDMAAAIVEPVAGNMGCVLPQPGFLEGLRDICTEYEAVLIFDEVMTGFRLAPGGAQQALGVDADLVTLGKIIGAGLPVGAVGGKQAIMDKLAPVGPVYQAGTLSGNPLAMAAGIALLTHIQQHPEIYAYLDEQTLVLESGLRETCQRLSLPFHLSRMGSMISLHFTDSPIVDFASAQHQNVPRFNAFFHAMLNRGVYLPPSAYESWFLSAAHTPEIVRATLAAAEESLALLAQS